MPLLPDDIIELIIHHKFANIIQEIWRKKKNEDRFLNWHNWRKIKDSQNIDVYRSNKSLEHILADFTEMTFFMYRMTM